MSRNFSFSVLTAIKVLLRFTAYLTRFRGLRCLPLFEYKFSTKYTRPVNMKAGAKILFSNRRTYNGRMKIGCSKKAYHWWDSNIGRPTIGWV
jgi:hypothetical protein